MLDFLFGWRNATRAKPKAQSRHFRPCFDVLEDRRLLAMTIFNISGTSAVQEPLTLSETKYVEFTISIMGMGGPPDSASVTWTASSQSGDTATADVDYQALTGTANLGPSQSSQVVQIPIYYDVLSESNETFRVTLSNPTSGAYIMSGTAYGTIIDAPVNPMYVSIAAGYSDLLEGETAQFIVSRSSSDGPLTVWFAADGTATSDADYTLTPAPSSISFANGQSSVTIDVEAIDDALLELTEYLELELLPTAPGTQGPSQYLIVGSSTAGMTFHDGYEGIVDTLFTVEYQDAEGTWHSAPDSETLWADENLKWLPTIPSEIASGVNLIKWIKKPHGAPDGSYTDFATGTPSEPATGNPGVGYWDISFRAFYDIVSYFLAAPDDKGVNDVASVVWEQGHAEQRFENLWLPLADGPEVFPEKNEHDGQTFNQVKIVVTLTAPCAPTVDCTVKLKVLDPDHFHNPVNADDEFDPNDTFGTGPGGATNIEHNDNRLSSGGIGSPGMTLLDTSLTIPAGVTTAFTIGTITEPQPGNNYIVPAVPRTYKIISTGISDDDGVTVVRMVSDFGSPPTITYVNVPEKYHTDILTVWRTLWVELDSMRAPNANDAGGPFLAEPDTNADLSFDPVDPSIGLFGAQYARACIDVKTVPAALDVTDGEHVVIDPANPGFFLRNMEDPDSEGLRASAMADIADENSDDFWVIQMVGGYEGPQLLSNDPNGQLTMLGRAISGSNIAYVFQEAIRDIALNTADPDQAPAHILNPRVALHESGHLFQLQHPNLDPMGVPEFESVMFHRIVQFGSDEENVFTFSELGKIQ
jgi:hypothetical protein